MRHATRGGIRIKWFRTATVVALCALWVLCAAAANNDTDTGSSVSLDELSSRFARQADDQRNDLYQRLRTTPTGPQAVLNSNRDLVLIGVTDRGHPVFYVAENLASAVTVGTDLVWPGGGEGFALTGANAPGELGLWDSGIPLASHQEFGSRISVGDGTSTVVGHSTQVAGTMIASGVNPDAHGMSHAALLQAFDFTDDHSEMATAAGAGMLISNHSYSVVAGWRAVNGDWFWYGDATISATEDHGFGFYSAGAQAWDEIAHTADSYLIVTSAGNDRDDVGPGDGGTHFVWDSGLEDWVVSTVTREADGGPDGYDSVSATNNAKNILTIGAVGAIAGGYSQPSDVVMTTYSGWGPTDDGRIKPDLVAVGPGTITSNDGSDTDYVIYAGTSASSPAVSGSLNLVLEHYRAIHAETPLASTLKGLAIHTAHSAGDDDGPDYEFGWGLLNTLGAVQVVDASASDALRIRESDLSQGETALFEGTSAGSETIIITLCWTDPAATSPAPVLNDPTPMLVNDLDLRLERVSDGLILEPFVLDPANPSTAATTGDNSLDNVEKVIVETPQAGTYRVLVSHKGTLAAAQGFSVITTGLNGDLTPPAAIGDLASVQVLTGNAAGSMTGIDLDWSGVEPGATVLVYRKEFGGYPEYTGAVPSVPADPAAALADSWQSVGGFTTDGITDLPATRDFWYHVVFVRDGVGNVSDPSNMTAGALNYHLGDVTSFETPGTADNLVSVADISDLGAAYGLTFGEAGFRNDLDVGPTSNALVTGRPVPDGSNGFEDLVIMSLNFGDVDKSLTTPRPEQKNRLAISQIKLPPVGQTVVATLVMSGDGRIQALSSEVSWNESVLALESTVPGDLLQDQGGQHLLLSPRPGVLDAALLGRRELGICGQGDLAHLRFRVISSGSPDLMVVNAEARDADNRNVPVETDDLSTLPIPLATALLSNAPNPFNPGTTVRFRLENEASVRISIYSLDGRLVRRLLDETRTSGLHEIYWDGRDGAQRGAASGMLLLRMEADGQVFSRRMLLLK